MCAPVKSPRKRATRGKTGSRADRDYAPLEIRARSETPSMGVCILEKGAVIVGEIGIVAPGQGVRGAHRGNEPEGHGIGHGAASLTQSNAVRKFLTRTEQRNVRVGGRNRTTSSLPRPKPRCPSSPPRSSPPILPPPLTQPPRAISPSFSRSRTGTVITCWKLVGSDASRSQSRVRYSLRLLLKETCCTL